MPDTYNTVLKKVMSEKPKMWHLECLVSYQPKPTGPTTPAFSVSSQQQIAVLRPQYQLPLLGPQYQLLTLGIHPQPGCLWAVSLKDFFVTYCSHSPSLLQEEGPHFLCGDRLSSTDYIDNLKDGNKSKGGNSNIQVIRCRQK